MCLTKCSGKIGEGDGFQFNNQDLAVILSRYNAKILEDGLEQDTPPVCNFRGGRGG